MLRLYRDQACQDEITQNSPDFFEKAVLAGGTLTDVAELYIKSDDSEATYKNIYITGIDDEDSASESGEIDILYSADGSNYVQELNIPDGEYTTPLKIYRKAIAPAVTKRFNRVDIKHELGQDEYEKRR